MSRVKQYGLFIIAVSTIFLLVGCGSSTGTFLSQSEKQKISPDAIKIVDYNIKTDEPLVLLKNTSKNNLKDVKVKLTAKDNNGNVLGVKEGNFGITSDLAMLPGEQVGMKLVLGNGSIPENAKLEWEIEPELATMEPPKVTILKTNVLIKDGTPVVSGEIKNESGRTITAEMYIDYFKNGKIIGSESAVYADTYDMLPGKVVSFSEKAVFLPDIPDSYRIHFTFTNN